MQRSAASRRLERGVGGEEAWAARRRERRDWLWRTRRRAEEQGGASREARQRGLEAGASGEGWRAVGGERRAHGGEGWRGAAACQECASGMSRGVCASKRLDAAAAARRRCSQKFRGWRNFPNIKEDQ